MKRRGRPPKVRPIPVHTPSEGSKSASTSPADDTNPAALSSQSADLVGQCWFIQREDERLHMDIVAMWCGDFENFSSWRTKPKQLAGEKVALFLISHGHPKREGRECEKNVGNMIMMFQVFLLISMCGADQETRGLV